MAIIDRAPLPPFDVTGALNGYRVWLGDEPIGPAHSTFTRAVTAKALLMGSAHDALGLLAATLAKPRSEII